MTLDITRVGVQPVEAWPAIRLGAEYLDYISIAKLMSQLNELAIDLGPGAAMAQLGMNVIGEIKWSGPSR